MSIFVLVGGAMLLGFVLIAFISRSAPPASVVHDATGENWISRLSPDQFAKLLGLLFAELKFEVESSNLRAGDVDIFATNPTPITGIRLYIRGVFHPPLGMVGEDEVRVALETSRAEMAGKAVVVTPGGFTADAKASAQGAPVDLIDGAALLKLVKKHLPQVFAEKHV